MGSPFASLTTSDPIPVPFDPPHTITVRKLTGREVEQAQEAHARGVAIGRSRLWSENFKRVLEKGLVQTAEFMTVMRDPLTGYDRFVVARAGLVAWSYPQAVTPIAAKPAMNGTAAVEAYDPIEDLDDETVEFIAREILRRTKPALFQTLDEAEDEKKTASNDFTAA